MLSPDISGIGRCLGLRFFLDLCLRKVTHGTKVWVVAMAFMLAFISSISSLSIGSDTTKNLEVNYIEYLKYMPPIPECEFHIASLFCPIVLLCIEEPVPVQNLFGFFLTSQLTSDSHVTGFTCFPC